MSTEPEENLLEFSMKYLDAVFGTGDTSEKNLTRIEVNDPSKPNIKPPDEKYVPDSQNSIQTNSPGTQKNLPTQTERTAVRSKEASSDLINSKQTTANPSTEKEVSAVQLNNESKEKAVTATQLNGETKEGSLEKRSSGLIDATLKRKSIIGLENIEFSDNLNAESITEELHIETDNPSHLFWVPAHLHPEIAPNEFRKWLKNHAKDDYSSGISSLRRRKSTLSRQYIPSENDEDEKPEKIVAEKKLTGFDWESFAASDENMNVSLESTKLNKLLILNVDSPVLIPRMAPALKRTARTKIRRNSVAGEQNPRRFSAHRRTKSTHVLSDKSNDGRLLQIRAKKTSDPNPSSTLVLPQSDESKIVKEEITLLPHRNGVNNDIELDYIESSDISGPIRITLKDDNGPAPRRTSSLPQNAHELSDSLQDQISLPDKTKLYVDTAGTSKTTAEIPAPTSISQTSPDPTDPPQQKRTSTWTSWLFGANSDEKDKESKTPKVKENLAMIM
ncbi:12233_t:CDS:2 [Acaulospora colombiana]|uniref:12233_t:CDS:1 n=1 Tax=Acaulospora colombiana TaxID=27376 RepID=A0ACA9JYL3_9GLOM|nr:12233_t:CDS:2 [Acaulospora colombiana]